MSKWRYSPRQLNGEPNEVETRYWQILSCFPEGCGGEFTKDDLTTSNEIGRRSDTINARLHTTYNLYCLLHLSVLSC